jgi:hypothetical protein
MAGSIPEWLSEYVVEPLSQIGLLLRESLSLRRVLVNRFTVVLAIILLATTGANGFMDNNDGDRLTGTVVSEDGTPVENATVTVRAVGIENQIASTEVVTDGSGQFVIDDYSGSADSGVDLRIRVRTEDGYEGPTFYRHTFFPGQSIDVRLRLDRS